MFYFYPLVLQLYKRFVWFASFFNSKAKDFDQTRKTQWHAINTWSKANSKVSKVWIHSASLGEYEMSKPIIKKLKETHPQCKFILSFFSPSGYNFAEYDSINDIKIYLPIDTFNAQKKLVDILNPSAVIVIKYEFWYNFMKVLLSKNIPYFYTSLHLEPDSYLFSKSFKKVLNLLKESTGIFCHNSISKEILTAKGIENAVIFGDTRIEQVLENKNQERPITFRSKHQTICFGSACKEEFKWIFDYVNKHSDYNYIIAPHDIDNQSIKYIKSQLNSAYDLYSESKNNFNSNILIIDTIGDLKYIYKNCDFAYVGGAFKKGPHNLLEPLVFGKPTICGPNVKKFPMAQLLIEQEFTFQINHEKEFTHAIKKCQSLDIETFEKNVEMFIENQACKMDLLIASLDEVLKKN